MVDKSEEICTYKNITHISSLFFLHTIDLKHKIRSNAKSFITGTNETSTLENMIKTCLNSKCCGFQCSSDTVCGDKKMPGKNLIGHTFMDEENCCVEKKTCDDYTEAITEQCSYTHRMRKRDTAKNEYFEDQDWKENCCENGIKCSDVEELNEGFCNGYEKHYDDAKKQSDHLFTLEDISKAPNFESEDEKRFAADLCCIDTNCEEKTCENDEKDAVLKMEVDAKIPFNTNSFQYCCGYNCSAVKCEELEPPRLKLRNLEESADLTGSREECCDDEVTTCEQEVNKNGEFCGAGRVPRQDDLDVLIYNDEAPDRCCEKETYV